MFKKLLLICCLLFLTNCAAPGTALLSPVITGAKTKKIKDDKNLGDALDELDLSA